MKKHASTRRALVNTMSVLLVLGLAACENSPTGSDERSCTLFDCMYNDPDAWRFQPIGDGSGSRPTLGVTPPSLPDGTVGVVYDPQTLTTTAGDGSYFWWLVSGSLPTGLSLSRDGVISGTPTEAGEWTFTVGVSNSAFQPGRGVGVIRINP